MAGKIEAGHAPGRVGDAEGNHAEAPTGAEYPPGLCQHSGDLGRVEQLEHEAHERSVEAGVAVGQGGGVGERESGAKAGSPEPAAGDAVHAGGLVDTGGESGWSAAAGEVEECVAGAGADVEHVLACS